MTEAIYDNRRKNRVKQRSTLFLQEAGRPGMLFLVSQLGPPARERLVLRPYVGQQPCGFTAEYSRRQGVLSSWPNVGGYRRHGIDTAESMFE